MTSPQIILRKSILWTAIAVPSLILPAFAQQEVDPTYYDPWAGAPNAAVRPANTPTNHKKVVRKEESPVARAKKMQPTQVRANMPRMAEKVTLQLALK